MDGRRKNLYSIVAIIATIALGLIATAAWSNSQVKQDSKAAGKAPSQCTDSFALSLAKKDNITPVKYCLVDQFTTGEGEEMLFIEIGYETGGREYLVKKPKQVITTIDKTYATPDLSLGSENKACKEIWTNDLRTMIELDPDHIKRSLLREGEEYKWRLEFTKFTGQLPDDPTPDKCVRTGVAVTNLDGTDPKVVGTPEFEITE